MWGYGISWSESNQESCKCGVEGPSLGSVKSYLFGKLKVAGGQIGIRRCTEVLKERHERRQREGHSDGGTSRRTRWSAGGTSKSYLSWTPENGVDRRLDTGQWRRSKDGGNSRTHQ
ncbi:hypothetical protein LXL04_028390 [Taraxacum kok-saghyz]